ncbi:GNAT family N-acetyltransferase [Microbacterium bovistercoris]|uniref:GNAT family N-acetyltransferase n=1 Tax=Microbacterium bovistercoris TaxID=2293570 RepID=A0A371NYD4_9MICO|nr:GNAT family N-acetyltransferase [Microbacterium bovistercoris]REJ08248.1 GNAT family N-acetyltransferase [Microbacterium bovistercoris]
MTDRMHVELQVVRDDALDAGAVAAIGELFDREYSAEFGPWTRSAPYGYAPAATRVLAFADDVLIGHVGYQPRTITVGGAAVVIGGVGGVLIAPAARGIGLGARMLHAAQQSMSAEVEFGYLGCREEVVPFYEAAGWRRITARERSLSRLDGTPVVTDSDPILIRSAARPDHDWPEGDIDLLGPPW